MQLSFLKGIAFLLGYAKCFQLIEIMKNLYFLNYLDKWMTQCFASIRMSNLCYVTQGHYG